LAEASVPQLIRDIYKTCWDMKPSAIMRHYLARAPYVCQGQSMNLFVDDLSSDVFTKCMSYMWKRGGKNGVYYTRQLAAADAQKVQVEKPEEVSGDSCRRDDPGCLTCQA
jgi:ribonucleotide reductase alpha subunit